MRSVELFAGAGGLAMGMSRAGFRHAAVVEWDRNACETFRYNQRLHAQDVASWPVFEGDARSFDYCSVGEGVVLVSGGPPCQPFSMGGKARGQQDERDMFPEAVRAVRELQPQAFIFENVKGLMREAFAFYFEYIRLQLAYPEVVRRPTEIWQVHQARLDQHQKSNGVVPTYKVAYRLLNAADYGVPQRRERVFMVGFRADLAVDWRFPDATHIESALLRDQWITGDYWDRHKVAVKDRPNLLPHQQRRTDRLRDMPLFRASAWATVRDALRDLPEPTQAHDHGISNHVLNSGARSYPGHTGSPLDLPAKTLKAGDHGVPGGENMLLRPDGTVRYFTVREAARLQTFPDDFVFRGSWSEAMRQLGNAVPVRLGETVATSVAGALKALRSREHRQAA